MFKKFSKKIFQQVSFLSLILVLCLSILPIRVDAQVQNNIKLGIISVTRNGLKENTRKINANTFALDGELGLSDDIRYQWEGVDLSTIYKKTFLQV